MGWRGHWKLSKNTFDPRKKICLWNFQTIFAFLIVEIFSLIFHSKYFQTIHRNLILLLCVLKNLKLSRNFRNLQFVQVFYLFFIVCKFVKYVKSQEIRAFLMAHKCFNIVFAFLGLKMKQYLFLSVLRAALEKTNEKTSSEITMQFLDQKPLWSHLYLTKMNFTFRSSLDGNKQQKWVGLLRPENNFQLTRWSGSNWSWKPKSENKSRKWIVLHVCLSLRDGFDRYPRSILSGL